MWNDFVQIFLLVLTGLLPLVNPPGAALIMLGLVPDLAPHERARLAWSVAFNSLLMLAVSISVGAYVLSFFGISIPVLRLAGGLVIAITGWKLLNTPPHVDHSATARQAAAEASAADTGDDDQWRGQLFYPLTLPITVGPGSIAVAIALGTSSPKEGPMAVHVIAAGCALLVLAVLIYLCMRYAGHLKRVLGATGTQVTLRLLAFVILCIGVQIGWLGVSELLATLPRA
jgi:multiple antibiotic resistance protein